MRGWGEARGCRGKKEVECPRKLAVLTGAVETLCKKVSPTDRPGRAVQLTCHCLVMCAYILARSHGSILLKGLKVQAALTGLVAKSLRKSGDYVWNSGHGRQAKLAQAPGSGGQGYRQSSSGEAKR